MRGTATRRLTFVFYPFRPPVMSCHIMFCRQGCWHVPAGAYHEWLCIDVKRGLRMGLDKLMPAPRRKHPPRTSARAPQEATVNGPDGGNSGEAAAAAVAAAAAFAGGGGLSSSVATEDDKITQVYMYVLL